LIDRFLHCHPFVALPTDLAAGFYARWIDQSKAAKARQQKAIRSNNRRERF
jgi:hypothetical protein